MGILKKNFLPNFILVTALCLISCKSLYAHCEIPCGIYDDKARTGLIAEHIRTIEKSMKSIIKLSADKEKNYNQLVRWINNKELHAEKLQDIVYQYFMTQRIKLTDMTDKKAYDRYVNQITLLHRLLVYAMKAKQTTDLDLIEKLQNTLGAFETSYFQKSNK